MEKCEPGKRETGNIPGPGNLDMRWRHIKALFTGNSNVGCTNFQFIGYLLDFCNFAILQYEQN